MLTVTTLATMVTASVLELSFFVQHPDELEWYRVVSFLYLVPPALGLGLVGLAVVRKRPRHPVGWLFTLSSTGIVAIMLSNGWTAWELPGSDWTVWAQEILGSVALAGLPLALLLFPTGTPPTPRWRWPVRVAWVALVGAILLAVLAPWETSSYPNELYVTSNPTGLGSAGSMLDPDELVFPVAMLLVLVASVSLWRRWRWAAADERQQVKWLGMAGLVVVTVIAVGLVVGPSDAETVTAFVLGDGVFNAVMLTLPIAMGFGILRYRLYDVDRLVSRTLAYLLVIAVLLAVYATGVIAVGAATGGAAGDLGVALATLLAASLFRPVQQRIKSVIDRRFNRRRAESERRIEQFRESLRDEVDLETIVSGATAVAAQALEPETVSLWIADPKRPDRSATAAAEMPE